MLVGLVTLSNIVRDPLGRNSSHSRLRLQTKITQKYVRQKTLRSLNTYSVFSESIDETLPGE